MSSLDYYDLISGNSTMGNKKPYLGTTLINELDRQRRVYLEGIYGRFGSRADLLHGDRVGHEPLR